MNILKHQLGMLHGLKAMSSYFSVVFRLHLRPLPSGTEAGTAAPHLRVQPMESKEIYWRCKQAFAQSVSSDTA